MAVATTTNRPARGRPAGREPPAQNDNDRAIDGARKLTLSAPRARKPVAPPTHPCYSNPDATVPERLRFIANADLALVQRKAPDLGLRRRTRLREWTAALNRGETTEAKILAQPKGAISIESMEKAIDAALTEEFRHQLALATRMHVVSIARSNNVGDQAADLHAQLAGRPRAYAFTTETADGQRVQFDDFDFATNQPIESKSLSTLVPRGASAEVAIHEYRQQMEKQAVAARDNGVGPVRWNVPPDVDLDLVDKVYGRLPKELRKHIHPPTRPAPPIR